MDKQEIIERNKLIAIFMGLDWELYYGDLRLSSDKGKTWYGKLFNEDWNALMPVVEKIEDCFDGSIMVRIHDKRCHIEMGTQYGITKKGENIDVPDCYNGFCTTKIEATWKACVQYIQWFNSQKQ